jgi:hypothetical protein
MPDPMNSARSQSETGARDCTPGYGCIATAQRGIGEDFANTALHAAGAIAVQSLVASMTGNWWTGAAAGGALFLGREIAQAEYRWIERFGSGQRANLRWWGGFDARVWDRHSIAGWIIPMLAVAVTAALRS